MSQPTATAKVFKGYTITDCPVDLVVRVANPRWPQDRLFECDTVAEAKAWVNAYRDGRTWAVQASLLGEAV